MASSEWRRTKDEYFDMGLLWDIIAFPEEHMVHTLVRSRRGWIALVLLFLLAAVAGCGGGLASRPTATTAPAEPTAVASAAQPAAATAAPASPAPAPDDLLALPEAFRYEATLRPAGSSAGAPAIISGQYRRGAWTQSAQTGDGPAEESVAVEGATYTRPAGEPTLRQSFDRAQDVAQGRLWTRWPGIGFDAAYGLASPFAVLRLYPLADEKARGVLAQVLGAPVATFRQQTAISEATVKRLLSAGITASAPDASSRAALETQIAPLAVGQTITYWVGEDGRIYRAAATLLAADATGQPAPWLEVIWRFWGYDDPAIVIVAPADVRDAPGPAAADQPAPPAAAPPAVTAEANLVVRVFASPGVPAQESAVTVYPAGEKNRPLDWRVAAESRFILPPGRYDVLAQMDYAEEWLRGVEITAGRAVERDVTFDFGTVKLTVTQGGKPIAAEVVTYPAGDRQNWVDWRSDNPATLRLRAGVYDVEIAYNDYKSKQTVTGLAVRAGEMVERVVEVNP